MWVPHLLKQVSEIAWEDREEQTRNRQSSLLKKRGEQRG